MNILAQQKAKKYLEKRFDIDEETGCHLWAGTIHTDGYGVAQFGNRALGTHERWRAHRLSYTIYKGPIPKGLEVRHICPSGANPACVNPLHLLVGTHKQNHADDQLGSGNSNAKLTEETVANIKRRLLDGDKSKDIAKDYDVHKDSIRNIKTGKTWSHIEAAEALPISILELPTDLIDGPVLDPKLFPKDLSDTWLEFDGCDVEPIDCIDLGDINWSVG